MDIQSFFDPASCTVTHCLHDEATKRAAIIDPVLDYDPNSGRTDTRSADVVIAYALEKALIIEWVLETHIHADHISAAPYLKQHLGGKTGVGAKVRDVQSVFKSIYNLSDDLIPDGKQFDRLFRDGEQFHIGNLAVEVMETPGHTPACISYKVEDAVFVGDTLFMPDFGSARCDFPGGDARKLYQSVQRLLALPPETRLFMCHDYAPGGRDYAWETTVAAQRAENKHLCDGVTEADFIALRQARDEGLSTPALMLPSVQLNIRAGALPPAEENRTHYLKIPINGI